MDKYLLTKTQKESEGESSRLGEGAGEKFQGVGGSPQSTRSVESVVGSV